jgi:hypothetical protein
MLKRLKRPPVQGSDIDSTCTPTACLMSGDQKKVRSKKLTGTRVGVVYQRGLSVHRFELPRGIEWSFLDVASVQVLLAS